MPDKDWKHESGEGRWKDYVNPNTGEHSVKEHHLKTVWQSCPRGKCVYELTNPQTRECTCTTCGSVVTFVVGISKLVDGKLVHLR